MTLGKKIRYIIKVCCYKILSKFNSSFNTKYNKYQKFLHNEIWKDNIDIENLKILINVGTPFFKAEEFYQKRFKKICGRHSYAGYGLIIEPEQSKIGAFCSIANCVAIGVGAHPQNFLSTHPFQYTKDPNFKNKLVDFTYYKPVIIGNDVWIGHNAIIKGGVEIGDGAIIGGGLL